MAEAKISELVEKTTLHDTDLVPIVDIEATPDETKKITGANVKAQVLAGHKDLTTGVHGVGANYIPQAPAADHLVRTFTKGWTAGKLLKGAGVDADPTEIVIATSGSYTGNATAGRAIPHGLSAIPRIVLITPSSDSQNYTFQLFGSYLGNMFSFNTGSKILKSVTDMDSTNFYVGDGDSTANGSGAGYYWVAIG